MRSFQIHHEQHDVAVADLHVSPDGVIQFMRSALEMREQFKFEFTKSLSLAIEIMAAMAEQPGFKRSDMSYFDVNEILSFSFYGTEEEIKGYISKELPWRRAEHKLMEKLILPAVITNAVIQSGKPVKAVRFSHGWIEFDTNEDYENACRWVKSGRIKDVIAI